MIRKYSYVLILTLAVWSCGSEEKEAGENTESKSPPNEVNSEEEIPEETIENPVPEVAEVEEEEVPEQDPVVCMDSDMFEGILLEPDPESEDYDEMAEFQMISDEDWSNLNKDEKFVYSFGHPEWFDQVCAESSPYNEAYLFGSLPWDNSGASMSTRQSNFVKENRAFVMDRIWACTQQKGYIEEAYLRALRDLNAYEMIPPLTELYRETKNNYILSLFMELMARDEYKPYQEWHKSSGFFESFEAQYSGVKLTQEIETELINMSSDYYAQQMRP